MIKIIKLASSSLAPTMRTGAQARVPAMWGVESNGQLIARILTVGGESMVVDAESGRVLHNTALRSYVYGKSRASMAKEWALKYFSEKC
jgi:hypothetical protein